MFCFNWIPTATPRSQMGAVYYFSLDGKTEAEEELTQLRSHS